MVSIIDLNAIKSEAEWYLYHYKQIKQLSMQGEEPIIICGKTVEKPLCVVNAVDKLMDSVDDLCRRIIIRRYLNNEYWKVTITDECISQHPYYRCVDKALKLVTLQLVAKGVINI